MPRIVISLTDGQKDVWVAAAHGERVSLSEWVRRAADVRAEAGLDAPLVPVPRYAGSLPATVKEFRGPDPKKKP